MVFSGPVVKFALLKLRKNQRKSKGIKSFSLKKLNPSSNLCPVLCLERYVSVTQSFRGSASNLILGIKSPHAPIGASSIARWIKSVLAEAGIDISVYSAHSTRKLRPQRRNLLDCLSKQFCARVAGQRKVCSPHTIIKASSPRISRM